MNPFHYPFVAIWHALMFFLWLHWFGKLLIVAAIALVVAMDTLEEQGPFRIAALARRFSWFGIIVAIAVAWWGWMSFFPEVTDGSLIRANNVFVFGLIYLMLGWYWVYVIKRGHYDKSVLRRAYRRIRFRLRWDSIAKSAGLSHIRDIRPAEWTTGGTVATIGSRRVQWVPVLWKGRRIRMGDGVEYLLRPARGMDIKRIVESLDAIAIAALGHSATLVEADDAHLCAGLWPIDNWWKLTVYWSDPAKLRPTVDWQERHGPVIDVQSAEVR